MTATITGRMKGAPSSVTRIPRPGKLRRARARATGMASATLIAAESTAWTSVKRRAAQSAASGQGALPARASTATSVPSVRRTASDAAAPDRKASRASLTG